MAHSRPFDTFTIQDGPKRGKEVKPAHQIRVFVRNNRRRHFVDVVFWEHLGQMRACHDRGSRGARDVAAFWSGELQIARDRKDALGREIVSRRLGLMHLCLKTINVETIAHEAYHAVQSYACRRGFTEPRPRNFDEHTKCRADLHSDEEWEADFAGFLTACIVGTALELCTQRGKPLLRFLQSVQSKRRKKPKTPGGN